ncbi:DoxX family protein [Rudaea sp.]|uniref:DoxX family protein n=1 Tax=Rudaea sp. TaxID=2136325 RepID=UPI0032209E6D
MMTKQSFLASQQDLLLLIARVLLVILFLVAGVPKLLHFSGTVAYMGSVGAPLPAIAAAIAVFMEVPAVIALLVGFWTRPLALLLAIYTIGSALIGHPFWTMTGAEQANNAIHFYKNLAIAGGFLALCAAGPGRFSIDRG